MIEKIILFVLTDIYGERLHLRDETYATFREEACPEIFNAQLHHAEQLINFEYEINKGIAKGIAPFSCHYRDVAGKGTLSFQIKEQLFSGYFHNQVPYVFNGTLDTVNVEKLSNDRQHTCSRSNTTYTDEDFTHHIQRRSESPFLQKKAGKQRFIEIIFVISEEVNNKYGNEAKITHRFSEIFNIMTNHYHKASIQLLLLDIMIWRSDPVAFVHGNSRTNLEKFTQWRQKQSSEKWDRADGAYVFLEEDRFENGPVGLAWVGTMCSNSATGVIADYKMHEASIASTVSHEMGHNYGMSHDDDIGDCDCNDSGGCIMSSVISSPSQWSACSKRVLKEKLNEHDCMKDKPPGELLFGETATCGNGIKEKGEDCDCGPNPCPCCNHETCKLQDDAECSPFDGICCSNECKLRNSGSVCREPVSECDLPEYCDGVSVLCPRNDFKHTAYSCAEGEGRCYGSICKKPDNQCRDLYGKHSATSPECMKKYNTEGHSHNYGFGCGHSLCKSEDAVCGKLHCVGGTDSNKPLAGRFRYAFDGKIPLNRRERDTPYCKFIYRPFRKSLKSINISLIDDTEAGMVENGIPCGENRFCILGSCESIFDYYECPNDCSGNGICNNRNQCSCDCGWSGPDCSSLAWCQEKYVLAKTIIIAAISVLLIIFLVIYFVCVFYLNRDWKRPFSRSKDTSDDKYTQGQDAASVQKRGERSSLLDSRSVADPPAGSSKVEIIDHQAFQRLQRLSYSGPNNFESILLSEATNNLPANDSRPSRLPPPPPPVDSTEKSTSNIVKPPQMPNVPSTAPARTTMPKPTRPLLQPPLPKMPPPPLPKLHHTPSKPTIAVKPQPRFNNPTPPQTPNQDLKPKSIKLPPAPVTRFKFPAPPPAL